MRLTLDRLIRLENIIHRTLVRRSLEALRISVGAIFLGFGILKFFPGVSPAEGLVKETTELLTFGLVPDGVTIVAVAILECFIGICLLIGQGMRIAIWLLAIQLIGIVSPVVLLSGRLFSGPNGAPTLEGQYVLKDIILVTAGMVIAAGTFRGGRLVRDEPQLVPPVANPQHFDAEHKLQIVLEGVRDDRSVGELCEQHGISEAAYYEWRDDVLDGATRSLGQRDDATA